MEDYKRRKRKHIEIRLQDEEDELERTNNILCTKNPLSLEYSDSPSLKCPVYIVNC
jgi:hypothetical protein